MGGQLLYYIFRVVSGPNHQTAFNPAIKNCRYDNKRMEHIIKERVLQDMVVPLTKDVAEWKPIRSTIHITCSIKYSLHSFRTSNTH